MQLRLHHALDLEIVFETGADPVALGLIVNLNRPSGNITGVTSLNAQVGPKRLELLHEIVPTATTFGLLVNQIRKMPRPPRKTCKKRPANSDFNSIF